MDSFDAVAKVFMKFGYKILEKPKGNENGTDMFVVGRKKAIRVEIKTVREISSGSWQAPPIEKTQTHNDVVAAVFPNGYVILEAMPDYLKNCTLSGIRTFTYLKLD